MKPKTHKPPIVERRGAPAVAKAPEAELLDAEIDRLNNAYASAEQRLRDKGIVVAVSVPVTTRPARTGDKLFSLAWARTDAGWAIFMESKYADGRPALQRQLTPIASSALKFRIMAAEKLRELYAAALRAMAEQATETTVADHEIRRALALTALPQDDDDRAALDAAIARSRGQDVRLIVTMRDGVAVGVRAETT